MKRKSAVQEWLGDAEQRLMTHLVNRSFKKHPTLVDRLAVRVLNKKLGEVPPDPELLHPEAE